MSGVSLPGDERQPTALTHAEISGQARPLAQATRRRHAGRRVVRRAYASPDAVATGEDPDPPGTTRTSGHARPADPRHRTHQQELQQPSARPQPRPDRITRTAVLAANATTDS